MPGTSLASAFSFSALSVWLQAELVMSFVPMRITATLGCRARARGDMCTTYALGERRADSTSLVPIRTMTATLGCRAAGQEVGRAEVAVHAR